MNFSAVKRSLKVMIWPSVAAAAAEVGSDELLSTLDSMFSNSPMPCFGCGGGGQ